jgi:cytochrome c biogenesis protein CcmG/thiol:disulfide interchange protein DsbE
MTIMMKMFLALLIAINVNSFGFDKNASNTKSNTAEAAIIKLGENKAPDFALKSFDGKTVKLSDYKGKVVIIDFWATWCPPCRKGIPDLISIQDEYKKDVVIIGISLDSEKTIKDVPGFVKSYVINYPIVYGNEKVVNDYGGIEGIPTAFVVDKKGNIVDKHVGLVPKDTYVNKIKELLK